jgi:hypothetical protein
MCSEWGFVAWRISAIFEKNLNNERKALATSALLAGM